MSDTKYKELNVSKAQLLILSDLDEALAVAKEDENAMHMAVVIMNKAKILGVTD